MSKDLGIPLEHSRGYWTVGVRPLGLGMGVGDPNHLVPDTSKGPLPTIPRIPDTGLLSGFSSQIPPYLKEYAHSGPSVQVYGERSFRMGNTSLFLVPQATLDYHSGFRNYRTPGGEPANSQFHALGGGGNLLLRYAPIISPLDGRLQIDAGLGMVLAGIMTPFNTYENLPQTTGDCPADVPPVECEPAASGARVNTGTTGLLDNRTGGSRDAEGALAFQLRAPVTVHYEFPVDPLLETLGSPIRDTGASIAPELTVQPDVTAIVPRKGTGGLVFGLTAMGGVSGRFNLPTP